MFTYHSSPGGRPTGENVAVLLYKANVIVIDEA
jgi:hypothetical protein